MNATIGITGAGGYIGSLVTAQCIERGYDVIPIDNQRDNRIESISGVDILDVDVRDRSELAHALNSVEAIIHLAAVSGVEDCEENPVRSYEINITGTANVCWLCRATGAGLVFPFSMAVIGEPQKTPITIHHERNPINWYGRTKHVGENVIDAMAAGAFPARQLMISNVYGKHRTSGETVEKPTVINHFIDQAKRGENITVYEPGTQARDFIHVRDVAAAICHAAEDTIAAEPTVRKFEIASGQSMSVLDVAKIVQSQAGNGVEINMVENPRESEAVADSFVVSTTAAEKVLNWSAALSVEEAVSEQL